jgi:pyruvate/2-oxoglutarate/acetoin dehydrogenase E1 component
MHELNGWRDLNMARALDEALAEEMARDSRVFVMGEDVGRLGGVFTVTRGLLEKFGPERVRDTPVSEAAIVGLGLGAAVVGMRPVVELMYMDLCALAMDQIVNHAAKFRYMYGGGKLKVPLVIRTQVGYGRGMGAQHSQSLEAWFAHVPGLKVVIPSNACDAKGLLKSAIRDDNPVLFVEHTMLYFKKARVPSHEYTVPLGVASVVREGRDATIVCYGMMVQRCLEAADELSCESREVEVIDMRTVAPLDTETIASSVKKTNRLIIVQQACRSGGLAGEIAMSTMERVFDYLDAPIQRVAGVDAPIPFNRNLEARAVPSTEDIVQAVRATL